MSLSELCSNMIIKKQGHDDNVERNVVEFITDPWGLGLGSKSDIPPLHPVQMFIIKFYYGIELDNSDNRNISITDKYNEVELYRFNEREYMTYLFNEGRLNRLFEGNFRNNMVLAIGRRAGKTTIISTMIAYELYKLLNRYCPQEYYKIMPESNIRVTTISTSRETAGELYGMILGHIERAEFFRKFRAEPTKQWIYLRTQRDIDKYGPKGLASLQIRVAPCNARGLRGPGNIAIGLDEFAFFFVDDKKGEEDNARSVNSDRSDKAIFKAVTPSVATFKKEDGTPDGKVFCISSPGGKFGKFYEEFERGFQEDTDDLFCMRAPTWEVNPTISSQFLKSKFRENPITYKSEYGAEFSDRLFGWIDDPEIVRQNVVPGFRYKTRNMVRTPHFMGVDIGLKNDGSAITIGHWENELVGGAKVDRLEIDASDVRYAENENKNYFIPDELVDWLIEYTKKFYIYRALMDQYYGMSIIPSLHKKGHKQFEYRDFGDSLNSTVYQNLLTCFISSELRLPEGDPDPMNPDIKDSELVKEILTLQAEQRNKYMIKVQAPKREGMHDDLSDSLARMVFLSVEYRNKGFISTGKSVIGASSGTSSARKLFRKSEMIRASLNRPSSHTLRTMASRSQMVNRSLMMSPLSGKYR